MLKLTHLVETILQTLSISMYTEENHLKTLKGFSYYHSYFFNIVGKDNKVTLSEMLWYSFARQCSK